jgi:hypothetical protein
MEVRALLARGLVAGLLAGIVAFGFAKVVGEPQVVRAIAFEAQLEEANGPAAPAEPDPVSRETQSTIGLATGTIVMSVALGGLFALVFAFARGRVGPASSRANAALIAGAALVTVYIVPFLKYPANPPSVGDPDTIGHRTVLYFMMIDLSILFAVGAVFLWRRLRTQRDAWDASILTGLAYVAAIAITYAVMPSVNEVPEGFPAASLWKFRVASFGIQTVMWATIGLAFGFLTERALTAPARTRRAASTHAAAPT